MCCYRGMLSHVCSGRCASISYVLVWQGLCSFKTRRQRAVGGDQGALVLAAMFPWVMPTHLGTLQEGGGVRRGKERRGEGNGKTMSEARWTKSGSLGWAAATGAALSAGSLLGWTVWQKRDLCVICMQERKLERICTSTLAWLRLQNDNRYYVSSLFTDF